MDQTHRNSWTKERAEIWGWATLHKKTRLSQISLAIAEYGIKPGGLLQHMFDTECPASTKRINAIRQVLAANRSPELSRVLSSTEPQLVLICTEF